MKNSFSGILTAFIAGAAVGAIFGILYAPEKGSVTRSRLKTVGDELGEDLADAFETIKKEFTEEEEPVRKKATRSRRRTGSEK
jgi:gas vesicle protein